MHIEDIRIMSDIKKSKDRTNIGTIYFLRNKKREIEIKFRHMLDLSPFISAYKNVPIPNLSQTFDAVSYHC